MEPALNYHPQSDPILNIFSRWQRRYKLSYCLSNISWN